MKNRIQLCLSLITLALLITSGTAQVQNRTSAKNKHRKGGGTVTPQAGPPLVQGSGTIGQISKWVKFTGTNYVLGDSIITEANGNIGISTTTPGSKLTVQGMIETTLGGLKFPDGTVQTTAAAPGLGSVLHDETLTGDGTAGSPLGVAIPLTLQGSTSNAVILVQNNGAGRGILALGGGTSAGIRGEGSESQFDDGGVGVEAVGGESLLVGKAGGIGILASGGLGSFGAKDGLAGLFTGDVEILGSLSKSSGSFKIDHPLDPENKYLYHSFVESPDMMNIYNGVAKLNEYGEAVVEMPDWFSSLNRDFRYLLTPMGAPAPGLYIAEELANNRFKIAGGVPGMKVSWQVTGIRQDAFANKHRIPVEEMKPEGERGYYLHPDAYDQPKERRIDRARNPEQIRQLKDSREQLKRKNKDR